MSKTFSITISDVEQKALQHFKPDLDVWANNNIHTQIDRCMDDIVSLALEDNTHTILSLEDKLELQTYLNNQGIVLNPFVSIPDAIRRVIVDRANL